MVSYEFAVRERDIFTFLLTAEKPVKYVAKSVLILYFLKKIVIWKIIVITFLML